MCRRFNEQGLSAVCVPKSYDDDFLSNEGGERDIPYAFVGSTDNPIYILRNRMLARFRESLPLQILRTSSSEEYRRLLNRIRFFISADVGMNEYMFKNFEALAWGCILVAYRQGEEEGPLGFADMENVVLCSSVEEAAEKIRWIESHPDQADRIAASGQRLGEARFSLRVRDRLLFDAIRRPIPAPRRDARPWWERRLGLIYRPPLNNLLRGRRSS